MNAKGLVQSGVWNYLREEITVALECRRCTRNSIHFVFDPSLDYPDSMRANIMSHILARVINHCFQNGAVEQHSVDERIRVQEALHRALDEWRESLPPSFEPFSAAAVATNSPFPSIWLLQPWHGEYGLASKDSRFLSNVGKSQRCNTITLPSFCYIHTTPLGTIIQQQYSMLRSQFVD